MNRFIKTLSLLIISLFFLSASIDATLDRLARSPSQSQLAVFDHNGRTLVVYNGDIAELTRADRTAQEDQLPTRRSL